MPRPAILIAAVIAIGVLMPRVAVASLTVSTTVQCGPGEYVVGLTGRTGAWIDAIGPVCTRWDNRTFQSVPGRAKRPVGGPGGGGNQQLCPAGSAIAAWQLEKIIADQAAFVDRVTVQCQTLAPPRTPTEARVFGGQNNLPRGRGGPAKGRCPTGQLATGVHAWVSDDGRFVTNVGMTCGPAPSVAGRMAWRSGNDGTVTYFSPELKVSSGDRIQLDWCRQWATDCGQPAADAFCKVMGQARALRFAARPKVGLTVIVSDRRICNAPSCTGFEQVVCGP